MSTREIVAARPGTAGCGCAHQAEVAPRTRGTARGGKLVVEKVPLLRGHSGIGPDLVLTWNDLGAAPRTVDVVVHLHGFSLSPGRRLHVVRDLLPRSGLDWSDPKGGGGGRRTRPTVGLLPRGSFYGGPSRRGYAFPALTRTGGVRQLIDFALQRLAQELGVGGLAMGRLILTAHSGGGLPLGQTLRYLDPHEVHVFDGLYQDPSPLIRWATRRIARDREALARGGSPERYMAEQGGALRVLYRAGTAPHSRTVAGALRRAIPPGSPLARWYRAETTGVGHVEIPPFYGWRLLADASADLPGAPLRTTREVAEEEIPPVATPKYLWMVIRAVTRGERDESRLTGMVFDARHPERGGRRIERGEPGFDALRSEWLQIRDRLVRPALARVVQPPAKPALTTRCQPAGCTGKGTTLQRVRALVPLLERHRGDLPLDFLLGWVSAESGGCNGVVTRICERGYFQVHPSESKTLGIDHDRLTTDPDYSVRQGIAMVRMRADRARKRGFVPGTELHLYMTKMEHWLPRGVDVILRLMRERGMVPATWAQLRGFAMENRDRILEILKQPKGSGWDPVRGIANAEKTLARGRELAAALGIR